jgi:hypothetical protein
MYSRNSAVKMAAQKKRVLAESEMKRLLEDSGSDFDDGFSENSSKSESQSDSDAVAGRLFITATTSRRSAAWPIPPLPPLCSGRPAVHNHYYLS